MSTAIFDKVYNMYKLLEQCLYIYSTSVNVQSSESVQSLFYPENISTILMNNKL